MGDITTIGLDLATALRQRLCTGFERGTESARKLSKLGPPKRAATWAPQTSLAVATG